MAQRPQVVAFDAIDTVVDMLPLEQSLKMLGLPTGSLRLWLTQTVRDGFALSIVGEHRSFGEVARSALVSILQQSGVLPSESEVQEIMAGIPDLPAHPDAEPAIRAARERGARVIALTNGTAEVVERLMRRLGLTGLMERIISADDVGRWKPHPEPYQYAASQLGVEPGQMALVTVHGWDALGAKRAGLTAGWASRLERHFPPALGEPDVTGANLQEVVTRLMALEEVRRAA
jgi:2-haloacid dehalogenase